MPGRYFVERPITEEHLGGQAVTLAGAEAHHLVHVMRARRGLHVVLFDGSGAEFPAAVSEVGRDRVKLVVTGRKAVDRELPRPLALAVALPKGERQRWLVEKAVELGVARLVPLRTVRSVAQPVEQALERLRRAVVEASKQCGRNRLMEIARPTRWPDLVAETRRPTARWMAHPGGQPLETLVEPGAAGEMLLAVGPEGGFSGEEVALARAAGWRTVDLGPRILRVETAALLLAALGAVHTKHAGGQPEEREWTC